MSTDTPEDPLTEEAFTEEDGVLYEEEVAPQTGILGFTLRELLIVGAWAIMFVTSFFPVYSYAGATSLWAQGIQWILPLAVPTVAVFLIVLRRFSPDGIRRVGSLGIDQFASVAFSVSALYWAGGNWDLIAVSAATGEFALTWLTILQFIIMLVLVVLTVFAPLIPGLRDDFRGRLVTLAHRNANPVRPVIARPRPERPAPAPEAENDEQPSAAELLLGDDAVDDVTHETDPLASQSIPVTEHASGGELGTAPEIDDEYVPGYARSSRAERSSRRDAEASGDEQPQPFWVLAPTERDVFDEHGEALFRIGPDAWALVIEDRGGAYVVRHDDGRIGYLHDVADITKA